MAERDDKAFILIVDDKADQLLAFAAVLGDLGVDIILASSGREALRHVLRREFALILLDINMPGIDGFETANLLRHYRGSKHTPIIFLTATGDDMHRERSYAVGAVDYILTPVIPEVLKTKVGVLVELYRKTEQLKRQAEALRRRAEQQHGLTRASLAINSARSLDAILRAVTDAARGVLGAHCAATTIFVEAPTDRARSAASASEKYAAWREVRPGEGGLFALARAEGRPVRMTEAQMLSRDEWRAEVEREEGLPVRGFLAAPITGAEGNTIGLVQLTDKLEGEFTEDDESVAVQLAQLASIAVQNALHAEAREANRLKDEFLATLSHELRTPLNAMLGWTRILRMGPHDEAKSARGLEVIERNVSAQVRLIDELLDISRITAGKLRINSRPLPLLPLVEAVCDALRPAAEAKGIALVSSLDGDACEVLGDPERLQQVVSNVLGNAVKFTPRNGRIDLGLRRTEDGIEIVVKDSGDGISREFLPFVFERFRQADSTSTRMQGGLGIGLAVVRHIVGLHGGTVDADSAGRGKGATFVIKLPTIASRAAATAEPEENGASPMRSPAPRERAPETQRSVASSLPEARALEGLYVVVVEDEDDARELLRELLSHRCARVTAVASAREALAAIDAEVPDVLVSDIAMPGEDGYELIRLVRERSREEGGHLPALALTAYARAEDRARALAAGFQMHAAKPIEPEALVAAVAALARGEASRRVSALPEPRAAGPQLDHPTG